MVKEFVLIDNLSKKNLYYSLIAIAVLVCVIGGFWWQGHSQTKAVAEEIALVRAARVSSVSDGQNYVYSGEVRGRYESQLAFQVGGKVIKRNVELGSVVHAGDLLMQIDPRDLQQTVNSNSANVYSAEAQLKLAESNLNRYRQLYAQEAISKAQLDQYQNAYDVAVAAVGQASAQYSQGSNQLGYGTLYADKAGVISSINVESGQVVSAGQTVMTIVQEGEQEIEINVPENRIEELRKATQIKIKFWALASAVADGQVREIAPMANSTTRSYKVRISLLMPLPEVKLGMTAAVEVANSVDQAFTAVVPLSAIYQTTDSLCVWIVKDNVVSLRSVQVTAFGDNSIQVVSGLAPDDVIVTAGVHKLREGQKVKIAEGSKR